MRDRTDRGDAADPSLSPQAAGRRVAIVTSRYHHAITSRLEAGAVEAPTYGDAALYRRVAAALRRRRGAR